MTRRLVPLAVLLFGLGLMAVALPHTIAGFGTVPAAPVLEGLRRGERVSDLYLGAAADAEAWALAWAADPQTWADLGLLRWELARRDGLTSATALSHLTASAAAYDQALALAPSMGLVWARRAQIELVRSGLTPAFERSLALSLRTAPFDPVVLWPRLDLALLAWPVLAAETRDLIAPQIAAAAGQDADRLAGLALRRFALGPIRDALTADPDRLARFEQALDRQR